MVYKHKNGRPPVSVGSLTLWVPVSLSSGIPSRPGPQRPCLKGRIHVGLPGIVLEVHLLKDDIIDLFFNILTVTGHHVPEEIGLKTSVSNLKIDEKELNKYVGIGECEVANPGNGAFFNKLNMTSLFGFSFCQGFQDWIM